MKSEKDIKIIECPRDAMQGIHDFIPTDLKIEYLNTLLEVGFDTLDFGSFVSPKAIPQMKDTKDLVAQLNVEGSSTKLLSIVANERGAKDACSFEVINYLGYPFSISETFQLRNTNATIEESVERVKRIKDIAAQAQKRLVIYISMGFGNPYGDEWNVQIVQHWIEVLSALGIEIFMLSDTVGVAHPDSIAYLYSELIPPNPNVEFGAHFHTTAMTWSEKVETAYLNGCHRFDGTIKGYGGCPMAQNDLVGNMPSERLIEFFEKRDLTTGLNYEAYLKSVKLAEHIFQNYH